MQLQNAANPWLGQDLTSNDCSYICTFICTAMLRAVLYYLTSFKRHRNFIKIMQQFREKSIHIFSKEKIQKTEEEEEISYSKEDPRLGVLVDRTDELARVNDRLYGMVWFILASLLMHRRNTTTHPTMWVLHARSYCCGTYTRM
jgi:hypothetical protein